MKAEEARKLANENSKRMTAIYEEIRKSAIRGNDMVYLSPGLAYADEREILKENGFMCTYEIMETDGAQVLCIRW